MSVSEPSRRLIEQYWGNLNTLTEHWDQIKKKLDALKTEEALYRTAVFELRIEAPTEGVNRVALANGYHLKADYKFNYNLKNKAGETEAALERIAKIGNEGTFIADRLVRWKPELSITEYRLLSPEMKKEIDAVLTITPGLPALEIEAPKAQKS